MTGSLQGNAFRQRMLDHRICGVAELSGDPQDKASQLIGYVYALTTYMSALMADPEGHKGPHLERQIDTLNKQVVSGAFDAISHLAAMADFFISEIE